MPSPHHGGAPLHANAPTLAKVTLRRAARVHRDARYASAPPPTRLARSLSTAPRTSFPGHSRQPSRREPIRSASCLVPHGTQPSAAPPGAHPQHLAPRTPQATALGRPARSLSTAPHASCPRRHSHQPPPQEPIHSASCLCPRPPHSARIRMRPVCTLARPWLQASPRATLTAPCSHRMQPYCTLAKLCCRPRLAPP